MTRYYLTTRCLQSGMMNAFGMDDLGWRLTALDDLDDLDGA
jgi:hypothetical protein